MNSPLSLTVLLAVCLPALSVCPLRAAPDAEPTPASIVDLTIEALDATNGLPIDAEDVDAVLSLGPVCGDGILDAGETCDAGNDPWSPGRACTAQCTLVACADTDDSGSLNVTDPVFLLNYLFLQGPEPLAPFSQCAEDITTDVLPCQSYPPCDGL